ncbi:hypothetical protein AB4523_11695 [Vibrio splendidus]
MFTTPMLYQQTLNLLNQRTGRSIGWAGDVVCVCGQYRTLETLGTRKQLEPIVVNGTQTLQPGPKWAKEKMRSKRAGRVPGARALAGTANKNYPHRKMYQAHEEVTAWKHVVCVLVRQQCPALPVFLGKADKQLPACLAALKHAFCAVVKIYT